MKWSGLVVLLFASCAVTASYPGDEIKLKRESIMCRTVTYLVEVDSLMRRGDQRGADRMLNIGRCKQNVSSRKAKLIRFGQAEGRPDLVLVEVRGKQHWVRYTDIRD